MSKGAAATKADPPDPPRRKRDRAGDRPPAVGGNPPDPDVLHEAAETFAMLASPTRLHLLWLLSHGEYDVGSLAEAVHGSDAMVSQHLAKLRLADLVTARRHGKRQIYVVDDDHVISLIEQALDHHQANKRD
jgi:DNA-binding transcriptional ArsR family regulator